LPVQKKKNNKQKKQNKQKTHLIHKKLQIFLFCQAARDQMADPRRKTNASQRKPTAFFEILKTFCCVEALGRFTALVTRR